MNRKHLLSLCLPVLVLGCAPTAATAAPAPEPAISAPAQLRGDAFAFDMFRALAAQNKGNITFSPESLEIVLRQLRDIATGSARAELAALPMGSDSRPLAVDMEKAAALFVAEDLRLKPGAPAALTPAPFATKPAQAVAQINAWCSDKTHGLIPELVSEADIDTLTRLVATSALYLKGQWLHAFDPQDSFEGDFHTAGGSRSATFMTRKGSFRLAAGNGWQAVALFYAPEGHKGEPACFIGILPTGDARAFAKGLTVQKYNSIRRALAEASPKGGIRVTLPKLTMESGSFSLRRALKASGVRRCFSEIELGGLTDETDLVLADVVQRCRVEIDEAGTTAAAATAAIVKARSLSPEITFNRPFIWVIGDLTTGAAPAFLGLCEHP